MSGLRLLQCQLCGQPFRRRYLNAKTKTRCPVCGKKTAKIGASDEQLVEEFRARERSKKQEKIAGNMNLAAVLRMDAIKAEQIPNSMHEAIFKSKCAEKGWAAHRPSWPDYIVETEKGMIAVEVKGPDDCVSKTQAATFDLLERMNVPVYVWNNTAEGHASLTRWKSMRPS